MINEALNDGIRGKTMLWTWIDGPTKGKTHEHVFARDGTVTWREVGAQRGVPQNGPAEAPVYRALKAADKVYLVSYLAHSGYTLTVALNLRNNTMVGFASSAKEWYPVKGVFRIVEDADLAPPAVRGQQPTSERRLGR
jgi:hypothetical protein